MKVTLEGAIATHKSGNLRKARKLYQKLLKRDPGNADCLNLLANIDISEGLLSEAKEKINKAIKRSPDAIIYKITRADILLRLGESDAAEVQCNEIIEQAPETASAYNLLGLIAKDRVDYDLALDLFYQSMKLETPNISAMQNYSVILHRLGKNELSEKYNQMILQVQPGNIEAMNNMGMALRCQGKLEEAKKIFQAVKESPKAQFNYGFIQLMQNNLVEGLPLYEIRKLITGTGKNLNKPEWRGEQQADKILLIISQQGLGDTILMSRFFKMIKQQFKQVIIQTGKPLLRLMESIDPELKIVSSVDNIEYDLWCDCMSLPYLQKINSVGQIPNESWLEIPGTLPDSDKLKVGINWAGNPDYHYDRIRSTALETFSELFSIEGVEWYSLHKGCREHEAELFNLKTPLDDAKDFYDTAAVINGLDLVISTETAIPNLAGALGIPTCVLTNVDVDWRWDAWYESVTICRQKTQGNWSDPVEQAMHILEEKLQEVVAA